MTHLYKSSGRSISRSILCSYSKGSSKLTCERVQKSSFLALTGDLFYLLEITVRRLLSHSYRRPRAARADNANELTEKFRIYKKMLMFFAAKLA